MAVREDQLHADLSGVTVGWAISPARRTVVRSSHVTMTVSTDQLLTMDVNVVRVPVVVAHVRLALIDIVITMVAVTALLAQYFVAAAIGQGPTNSIFITAASIGHGAAPECNRPAMSEIELFSADKLLVSHSSARTLGRTIMHIQLDNHLAHTTYYGIDGVRDGKEVLVAPHHMHTAMYPNMA